MAQLLDTIIIGAGSAGLSALREVRKQTERFLIVNEGPWGTTCARVGCMPSKTLIEAANAFHQRKRLDVFGIRGSEALTVDLPAVLARVRALRDEFVASALKATEDLGEARVDGRAMLLGPTRVEVNGRAYTTKSIILATGTRPRVPAEWLRFGDRILTTDTLFERTTLGPRMAVIGMGVIGVELSQALARLGVQITAFSSSDRLGGLSSAELNAEMAMLLQKDMVLHLGGRAQLREVAGGIEVDNGRQKAVVDQVLVAMGRVPNVEHLGLETLGVPLGRDGRPPVSRHTQQIADLPVFMPGDANSDAPLLHEAADEGYIAGINALAAGSPTAFVRRTPLAIVFSDPQIASVGERARDLDPLQTVTGTVRFANQGRARTAQRNQGRLHVLAHKTTGRLLGAELCAPDGEHLAHLLALAIGQKMTVQELLGMPIYHPTLEEGLRSALRDAAKQVTGTVRTPSDLPVMA